MVLVSHRYKFVYLKNFKVAGTSVESFFEKYCLSPEDEKNWSPQHANNEQISEFGIIGSRFNLQKTKWYHHMTAFEVRRELGDEVFNSYFKFSVVRNPWDLVVSGYYYNRHLLGDFDQFIEGLDNHKSVYPNWLIHTIGNKPVCDYYIHFENLQAGISDVCKILGIANFDLSRLPQFKSHHRPKDSQYQKYYSDYTRDIIARYCEPEITYFGYQFSPEDSVNNSASE